MFQKRIYLISLLLLLPLKSYASVQEAIHQHQHTKKGDITSPINAVYVTGNSAVCFQNSKITYEFKIYASGIGEKLHNVSNDIFQSDPVTDGTFEIFVDYDLVNTGKNVDRITREVIQSDEIVHHKSEFIHFRDTRESHMEELLVKELLSEKISPLCQDIIEEIRKETKSVARLLGVGVNIYSSRDFCWDCKKYILRQHKSVQKNFISIFQKLLDQEKLTKKIIFAKPLLPFVFIGFVYSHHNAVHKKDKSEEFKLHTPDDRYTALETSLVMGKTQRILPIYMHCQSCKKKKITLTSLNLDQKITCHLDPSSFQ